MPKKVYEINPFHGGINTKDDARDILDHQLVDALGVIDKLPKSVKVAVVIVAEFKLP